LFRLAERYRNLAGERYQIDRLGNKIDTLTFQIDCFAPLFWGGLEKSTICQQNGGLPYDCAVIAERSHFVSAVAMALMKSLSDVIVRLRAEDVAMAAACAAAGGCDCSSCGVFFQL
jgi:hypothetical protein